MVNGFRKIAKKIIVLQLLNGVIIYRVFTSGVFINPFTKHSEFLGSLIVLQLLIFVDAFLYDGIFWQRKFLTSTHNKKFIKRVVNGVAIKQPQRYY